MIKSFSFDLDFVDLCDDSQTLRSQLYFTGRETMLIYGTVLTNNYRKTKKLTS